MKNPTWRTGTEGPAKKRRRAKVPGNQQGYGARLPVRPNDPIASIPGGERPALPGQLLRPGDRGTESHTRLPNRPPAGGGNAPARAQQAGWVQSAPGAPVAQQQPRFKSFLTYQKPGGQYALSRQGQVKYGKYRRGAEDPLTPKQWMAQGMPRGAAQAPGGRDPVATAPGAPANPQSPAGPTPGSTPTLQNPNGAPLPGAPVPTAPVAPPPATPVAPQLPTGPSGNAGAPLSFEQFQQIQPYLLQGQPIPPWIMQQLGMQPVAPMPGVA